MGRFKRIELNNIKAMQKTLDDLPDKNLGKTREEAAALLDANIRKALEKGYSVSELADIMSQGNVCIPVRMLRKKLTILDDVEVQIEAVEAIEAVKTKKTTNKPAGKTTDTSADKPTEAVVDTPVQRPREYETPAYYTPALYRSGPDTEL